MSGLTARERADAPLLPFTRKYLGSKRLLRAWIADRICEAGRFGQKTGAGWYRYGPGRRDPLPDPAVERIIEQWRKEHDYTPRKIGDDEIVERCILALINVGAMVLDEGVATRAADIDVVWTSGYGFPRHLGGPMFYADTLGLPHVADRIRYYHERLGHYWQPAELILRLAAENSSFQQRDRQRETSASKTALESDTRVD